MNVCTGTSRIFSVNYHSITVYHGMDVTLVDKPIIEILQNLHIYHMHSSAR